MGKWALHVGPFKSTKSIHPVAYRLELPAELKHIHNAFHVTMLKKFEPDLSQVIDIPQTQIDDQVSYEKRIL